MPICPIHEANPALPATGRTAPCAFAASADRISLCRQFRRQTPRTLACPTQRLFGITPCRGVNQLLQRRSQARIKGCRPPPARRTTPGVRFRPASNSRCPRRIVVFAIPVARITAETPLRPITRASVAAHRRRYRSLSTDRSERYFRRISRTCAEPITPLLSHETGKWYQLFHYRP